MDSELWILDFGFSISGLWFLEFRSRFPHSPKSKVLGLWTLGFGSWPLGYGLCVTPDFGLRIMILSFFDFDLWTLSFEIGFWILDFDFWNSGQGSA